MQWFLLALYAAIFFYLILKLDFFRLPGIPRWWMPAFFLLKIVAGVALWWVYTCYYPDRENADTWKYFNDSKVMHDAPPGDFFQMLIGTGNGPQFDAYYHAMNHWDQKFDNNLLNDAHTIIRVNAVMRFFSLGNYHIHSLFFSFLAFIGLVAIFRALLPGFSHAPKAGALLLFLFPSLVFWSSAPLKEAFVLLGLGGLIYHAFRFFDDKKIVRIVFILVCGWLVFLTKFYVLAAAIPALLGAAICWKEKFRAAPVFILILVVFTAGGLALRKIKSKYDPLHVLAWKQNDFLKLGRGGTYLLNDTVVAFISPENGNDFVKAGDSTYTIREGANYVYWYYNPDFSDTMFVKNSHDKSTYTILAANPPAGSLMETDPLQPTLLSFLKQTPQAFFRALFLPYVWKVRNPLFVLPALENLLFIALLILVVFFRRKPARRSIFGFCLTFSLLLLWVMGITTPILGALVRYRAVALPFLLLALVMVIDWNKFMPVFQRFKTTGRTAKN